MAALDQTHVRVPQNLKKQLAVAVRSIQWSYAIFWDLSPSQQGVLEWADGYYNGDIKTRKTVQAVELKADKIGLQRSEQLRELYKSLRDDEIDQAKRSSAALSPEDLSDAEWYYLVCMSFEFNIGESLPGRALANSQTIWLCNAQYADSKVFSRSLLAKSASIQTVVCFPYLDGVIELGVTELVTEDPSLVQHIKASLLDISKPVCDKKTSSVPHNEDNDEDPVCAKVGNKIVDTLAMENLQNSTEDIKIDENELPENVHEEFLMDSPDGSSRGSEHNHQTDDSFVLEGLNGAASQVRSWQFVDDEFSNGCHDSMNSSDCTSEAIVNQDKAPSFPEGKNISHVEPKDLQDDNHTKLSSLHLGVDDDLHYKRILSVIMGSSDHFMDITHSRERNHKSSFFSWKKGEGVDGRNPQVRQNMLKKVLFAVPLMHGGTSLRHGKEHGGKDCSSKLESNGYSKEHDLSDKQRENDKFLVLGSVVPSIGELCKHSENENFQRLTSMVPSITEADKASILDNMIKYLKELEARVEELESCMDSGDHEARLRRNYMDMIEQTSDNYDDRKISDSKKHWTNKRKASDIDETDPEPNGVVPNNGMPLDMNVNMKEKEVLIEMRCLYREYILLDIIDAMNNLQLDVHTVQSSTLDGILTLTLKSKFRGTAITPARMIKQALWKIAGTI